MVARTLVLADLHLCRQGDPRVAEDLARLVREHAGARIVFAGDLFDVSSEGARRPVGGELAAAFGSRPELRASLARHVDTGGELWLVAGNHDAEMGSGRACDAPAVTEALGLTASASARVRTTPWFFREGGLHVEHGHLYDPDNAPSHPLVVGAPSLGVHFSEQFIAPTGAYAYLNANDRTPLELLLAAFRWYGPRAPYVIYRYFYAAIGAMLQAGPLYRARGERDLGGERLGAFAEEMGIPLDRVHPMLE